jgi:hypothetical protein
MTGHLKLQIGFNGVLVDASGEIQGLSFVTQMKPLQKQRRLKRRYCDARTVRVQQSQKLRSISWGDEALLRRQLGECLCQHRWRVCESSSYWKMTNCWSEPKLKSAGFAGTVVSVTKVKVSFTDRVCIAVSTTTKLLTLGAVGRGQDCLDFTFGLQRKSPR